MKTKQAPRSIRRCLPVLTALIALSANACVAEDGSFDDFDAPALDELGSHGAHEFAEGGLENSIAGCDFERLKRCGKERAEKYQQCHDAFGEPDSDLGELITPHEASCRAAADRAFEKCKDGDDTHNDNWAGCWADYLECMNNDDVDYPDCGEAMEECLSGGGPSATTTQQSAKVVLTSNHIGGVF